MCRWFNVTRMLTKLLNLLVFALCFNVKYSTVHLENFTYVFIIDDDINLSRVTRTLLNPEKRRPLKDMSKERYESPALKTTAVVRLVYYKFNEIFRYFAAMTP